jgi:2',3'-cyclic-nucleotide 2'-phosphodiesterase (5'-nucleotidase family)
VDIAAIDSSSIRCGLPAGGALTFGDWFNLMPYADTVRLYRIVGRRLAALLDDNARRADRPGEPHVERGFVHFSRQVRYSIEPGESRSAARAVDAAVDGIPLDLQPDHRFLLAGTSFLREAAAPWERHARQEGYLSSEDLLGPEYSDTDLFVRQEMVAYIREQNGVTEQGGALRDGRVEMICR